MTYDRIAHAVHGAIGNEIRNQLARVTGTLLPNGTIPCYAEALGNVGELDGRRHGGDGSAAGSEHRKHRAHH